MKPVSIAISALVILLFPSCGRKEQNPAGGQALVDASRRELVTALEERDRLLKLVREISESMEEIKRLETLKAVTDAPTGDNAARRSRLAADIRAVRQTLRDRREQLQALEANFQKSELYTDELRGTINMLNRQIDSQARDIARMQAQLNLAHEEIVSLTDSVDSLNVAVLSVSSERDQARDESQSLENELNRCYYAVATKGELKNHHIVETAFLRKTRILKGDFDRGFFHAADKRTLERIPLGRHKGSVLTNHPESSYRIAEEADGTHVLVILDAPSFWSTTSFLVVQAD